MKLPLNCTVKYTKEFLSKQESKQLYKQLINDYRIGGLKTEITYNGKTSLSDYGKLMFIDQDLYEAGKFPEKIWGKTTIWSNELTGIKKRVESLAKKEFNVCVCIYYPDGNSGVSYHSDYIAFGDTTVIPSLSIGEEREFCLREKENLKVFEMRLEEGSLLLMGENCQQRYEHSLPVDPKYKQGRINLTFRQYGFRK